MRKAQWGPARLQADLARPPLSVRRLRRPSHGEFIPRLTNDWAGAALVRRHLRKSRHAQKHPSRNMRRRTGAAACRLQRPQRHRDRGAELRSLSHPAAAGTFMAPDGRYRFGEPLARRRQADRRQRHDGHGFRDRARASAHRLRTAERRRAGRRKQRAAEAGRRQGHQGFCLPAGAEMGGCRGAERQPHHAVARRRWRRRRGDAQHVSQRPEFAVRHGAGRRGFLCRQFRCDHEIPLPRGRHQDQRARRQACGPARRHHQSPLDQGSHRQSQTAQNFMRPSAPTAMSAKTASRPRRTAPPCWKSIAPAANGACSPRACATRTARRGIRRPASSGSSSTSATNSATISFPIT